MSDDNKVVKPDGKGGTGGSSDSTHGVDTVVSKTDLDNAIRRRQEALEQARSLEERLSDAQKKLEAYEQEKLTEQEKLQAQLSDAMKQLETYKEKADAHSKYEQSRKESIKEKLGEDYDPEFDALPLSTLERVAEKLQTTKSKGHTPPPGGSGKVNLDGIKYEDALTSSSIYDELLKDPMRLERLKSDWQRRGRPLI